MPYEYRLLEVRDAGWDQLQDTINQVAKEGYRYRDTFYRGDDGVVLIFEREATPENSDAWSSAREVARRGRTNFRETKIDQTERKYPPEEED
jgi:hypothetical protein